MRFFAAGHNGVDRTTWFIGPAQWLGGLRANDDRWELSEQAHSVTSRLTQGNVQPSR